MFPQLPLLHPPRGDCSPSAQERKLETVDSESPISVMRELRLRARFISKGWTPAYPQYWFPRAAVTNYHNRGSLKQQKFVHSSGDQKPEVKVLAGPWSVRGSKGESFLPLPAAGGSWRTWLWPPPSSLCLHLHMAPPHIYVPCFSYKDTSH